jgi:hypothetical protein
VFNKISVYFLQTELGEYRKEIGRGWGIMAMEGRATREREGGREGE